MFEAAVFVLGLIAGGVAAVAGFGIGSLLTPVLSVPLGTKLAVAVVSVQHFAGRSFASSPCGVTSIDAFFFNSAF